MFLSKWPELRLAAKPPVVQVVIPVYNRRALLAQCLESVFAQTFRDFAVVLVDDGSTDGSVELARSFGDRVSIIEQPNSGPAAARNAGVRYSNCAYVAFLDSDDLWDDRKLERQIQFMDSNPSVGASCADAHIIRNGRILKKTLQRSCGLAQSSEEIKRGIATRNLIATSTAVVRRCVFDAVGGFDESLRMSEDWDFWMRLSRITDIVPINEPLGMYRLHEDNVHSQGRGEELFRWQQRVIEKNLPPGCGPERDRALAAIFKDRGMLLLRELEMAPARESLLQSVRHRPSEAVFWYCLSLAPAGFVRCVRDVWRRRL